MKKDSKILFKFMINTLNNELNKIIDLNNKHKINNVDIESAFELVLQYYSLLLLHLDKQEFKKFKNQLNKLKMKF